MFDRIFIRNERQAVTPKKTMSDCPIVASRFNNAMPLYFTEQGGDRFIFLEAPDGRYISFISATWVIGGLRKIDYLDPIADRFEHHKIEHTVALQNQVMRAQGRA